MYDLNQKIEEHNNIKKISWSTYIKDMFLNIKPAPAFSIGCLAIVVSFSILKISNFNLSSSFLQNESSVDLNNYVAISESDSLDIMLDSLSNSTLIGKGR